VILLKVLNVPLQVGVSANFGRTEKTGKRRTCKGLVRKGGLEPPRFYPPDPKSGASANSATFARVGLLVYFVCHGAGKIASFEFLESRLY
jgi:hypothetical protein